MCAETRKRKCFVVMGFGEKPDFATGRTLDLDKTYRIIIKKAVEEAGLECIRADDIIHAGLIDKPMYQLLLEADVVVADLSTSNPNALYELGVRHALRPNTTIVLAEKGFKFPFDIKSLLIRGYEHLGKGIDAEEADRVRADLKQTIQRLLAEPAPDSPVYTFLPRLVPPVEGDDSADGAAVARELPEPQPAATSERASDLMELFQEARAEEDWKGAARALRKLLELRPTDPYLKQQLALATYKGKQPDPETCLMDAHLILNELNPETTTDPETLGLWGAVHKRLWELKGKPEYLDEGIRAYEKGFYLKNDYYTGINLAFMLNQRASVSQGREAIADTVLAERVRRRIIPVCEKLLASGLKRDDGQPDREQSFWVKATLAEALFGIGAKDRAETLKAEAIAEAPQSWMPKTLNEQLGKLAKLLEPAPAG